MQRVLFICHGNICRSTMAAKGSKPDACQVLFLGQFEVTLKIMGKNTDTLSERHVMRHYAELLGKNDLVFSVSVSGETQVSIDATSIAKTRGCKVVTLTGFSRNSLSKLADYPIYTVQARNPAVGVVAKDATQAARVLSIHIDNAIPVAILRATHLARAVGDDGDSDLA